MGMSPQQIDANSLWQNLAMFEGYAKAHEEQAGKLTDKEKDEIWDWMQDQPDTVTVTIH